MGRIGFGSVVALGLLVGNSGFAAAQTRSFACGPNLVVGPTLTVTVRGPASVSARPINGRTVTFALTAPGRFDFAAPGMTLSITPDQTRVGLDVAGVGRTNCTFGAAPAPAPAPTPQPGPPGVPKVVRQPVAPDAPPAPPPPVVNIQPRDFVGSWSTQFGADCLGCTDVTVTSQGPNTLLMQVRRRNGAGFRALLQVGSISSGRRVATGPTESSIDDLLPDADTSTAQVRAEMRNGDPILYVVVSYRSRRGFNDVLNFAARR